MSGERPAIADKEAAEDETAAAAGDQPLPPSLDIGEHEDDDHGPI